MRIYEECQPFLPSAEDVQGFKCGPAKHQVLEGAGDVAASAFAALSYSVVPATVLEPEMIVPVESKAI